MAGYTGNYLAAQCYRYAVTQDPRGATRGDQHLPRSALARGDDRGFRVSRLGRYGRRVSGGHQAGHGSGGYAAEWHDTADGLFEWKGDTQAMKSALISMLSDCSLSWWRRESRRIW
jgi:hypothetical protein